MTGRASPRRNYVGSRPLKITMRTNFVPQRPARQLAAPPIFRVPIIASLNIVRNSGRFGAHAKVGFPSSIGRSFNEPGIDRPTVIRRMRCRGSEIAPQPLRTRQNCSAFAARKRQIRTAELVQMTEKQMVESKAHFWPGPAVIPARTGTKHTPAAVGRLSHISVTHLSKLGFFKRDSNSNLCEPNQIRPLF